ncbi:MAG: hypothetical protein H0W61_02950 [Bacteroidetes bacterium]|nr:hypothetical protein [Bacteroidota bacterium]
MTSKSIVIAAFCLTQTAKGQNNFHKYYLEGQISSGFQQQSSVAGLGGAFGFYLNQNSSIDFRAREIYNFKNTVVIGAISINYRYHLSNGIFVGAGFGHHHEISEQDYIERPLEAAMGTHDNIAHRSGISAEIGYNFKPIASRGFFQRFYPTSSIQLTYMMKGKGPNPLVTANVGLRIGLQKY